MAITRRPVILALLALAAPLPALAQSEQGLTPVPGPAALSVSTSLDSCGVADAQIICKLDVSYNALPAATSYTATVTRADGSVIDYGSVAAGGTSLWVPYVGSGTYSVRITAYGEVELPDDPGHVISTEVSQATANASEGDGKNKIEVEGRSHSEAGTRSADHSAGDRKPEGSIEVTPNCSDAAVPPEGPLVPEPLPELPPEDLDPDDLDEDDDEIEDEVERIEYDAAVAEQTAAEAVAELPQSVDC